MTFYGKLAIDLLTCDKLLLPNTKVRLLIRARPNFYMISDNPHVSMRITDFPIHKKVVVAEQFHSMIEYQLIHQPALYNFMETVARTFIIPSQQNQFIQENIFHNAPIRRLAIAMNTNSAFTGSSDENCSIIKNSIYAKFESYVEEELVVSGYTRRLSSLCNHYESYEF